MSDTLETTVALLGPGSTAEVQEQAALVLGNMAAGDTRYQERIAATPGALAGLVALLDPGSPAGVQE
jgi:hypothetical protein